MPPFLCAIIGALAARQQRQCLRKTRQPAVLSALPMRLAARSPFKRGRATLRTRQWRAMRCGFRLPNRSLFQAFPCVCLEPVLAAASFFTRKWEKKHVVQTVLCPALLPPNTKELHIVTIIIVIASMVLSSSSSSRLFGLDCCTDRCAEAARDQWNPPR